MASTPQQQQPVATALVEEKHFRIRFERSSGLLKEAIEQAIGVPLVELAQGMWTARISAKWDQYEEITVRALPSDEDGTTVEVRLEHQSTPAALAVWGTLFMALMILVVPIIFMIAMSTQRQKERGRQRMLQMHKIWTELASTVGAPLRAGYRDRPERVRARVASEEPASSSEEEEAEEPAREASRGER